ncbi:calcitonin gene-related peptide type 1 receptor-like [Physella acuta]|uniref:calcitonin gene-related peptide type 1 receptor-like n=1 Tax=Physella acuta TaxID=109671 RepID=UPI0027DB9E4E|nr:calcitonin gene-related peptide type 1 receptor-like [Physella acuta]
MKGETMKGETMKGETMKGETEKGETCKGETMKGETMKGETMKGETMKGETMKGETMKDETEKGETKKGETKKGETMQGETEKVYTFLLYLKFTFPCKQPSCEEPSCKQPSCEEPSCEEPSCEEPSRKEPSREEPSRKEPSRKEPSRKEPSREEPSREEPSREEPSCEEPSCEEPSSQKMVDSEVYHPHVADLIRWATEQCSQMLNETPVPGDGVYCPGFFDGFACFNHTRAGTLGRVLCSEALPVFPAEDVSSFVFLQCLDSGQWERADNQSRANYSACTTETTQVTDTSHIYLFFAGSAISVVLLAFSLLVFQGFLQLRCDRVTIHKNLFVSYLLTSVVWTIYYKTVILNGHVILENPLWCRVLHMVAHYCSASNFSWMLCEGLYLHIIMAHALRTGKKLIKCLVIGGWGVPFLFNVVYGAVRASTPSSLDRCWITDDHTLWIVSGPIAASILVNIGILINLVRLLMTKLRQIPDANQSRKAAKATLILVPLFGLHYLVLPLMPPADTLMHTVYLHIMALLFSLQGALVSIIFCLCNGEVRTLIRRKWQQHRLMSGRTAGHTAGLTSTTFIDGYSVVDSTRDGTVQRSRVVGDYKTTDTFELQACPLATTPLVQVCPQPTTPLMEQADGNL